MMYCLVLFSRFFSRIMSRSKVLAFWRSRELHLRIYCSSEHTLTKLENEDGPVPLDLASRIQLLESPYLVEGVETRYHWSC